MKTTELFVEQVLIGGLVLLTFGLAFREPAAALAGTIGLDDPGLLLGAFAVGAAYLLGIVFDRLADSLWGPLDALARIRFALGTKSAVDQLRDHPDRDRGSARPDAPPAGERDEEVDAWCRRWDDPFKQARIEVRLRILGGEAERWRHYLRSRIRLTRGLAVYLPALTFAAALATAGIESAWPAWLLPAGIALAAAGTAAYRGAPHTGDGRGVWEFAAPRGYIPGASGRGPKPPPPAVRDLLVPPVVLLGIVLLVAAFGLTWRSGRPELWMLPVAGTLLTFASAWAWWRINETLMKFLRDFDGTSDRSETPA